ncbi:MAG: HlyD family efflux transporter periplasmic adaptor subunit [Phormidesmis sp.]
MIVKVWSKPAQWRLIGFGLLAAVFGGLAAYAVLPMLNDSPATELAAVPTLPPTALALGRLEPASAVVNLSLPLALEGDRIAELLVAEGETVEAGQVVAIMDSSDRLQQLVAQAEAQMRAAQQKLALVQAGEKQGIITAQQADIARLEADLSGTVSAQSATLTLLRAELQNAQVEFARFEQLYKQGAVSASARDEKQTALAAAQAQVGEATAELGRSQQTLQAQITSAQANLEQLREVRPEDIAVAQAEVDSAAESLAVAKTELSKSQVRAPMAGRILKIHSYPGEATDSQGLAELGQTQRMVVVAEVDESDIQQVQIGQSAVVTGDAFTSELRGTVERIGQTVSKQSVFSNQPGSNLDSRVVEVRIALNAADSQKAAGLTNLQVETAIQVIKVP